MSDPVVVCERRGAVALLTLNRPDRLNAWTQALEAQLFAGLDAAMADPAVRAVVVTGAGRGFCAGADMDMLQGIAPTEASGGAVGHGRQIWELTEMPKPVIGAINGACAGIGLSFALALDLRFAAEGAKFTTAFARRGLIAEHSMSYTLPRLAGPAHALDLLLSGRVFLAEEAHALGVVNAVVRADGLLDHALAYAADLAASSSPTSMAVMKRQVWGHAGLAIREATDRANELMRASLRESDFKEGVSSFVQKRPPTFSDMVPGWALDA